MLSNDVRVSGEGIRQIFSFNFSANDHTLKYIVSGNRGRERVRFVRFRAIKYPISQ